jgi:hypothetical protein
MDGYRNDVISSESESEGSVNEARVYTTKANSPKKGPLVSASGVCIVCVCVCVRVCVCRGADNHSPTRHMRVDFRIGKLLASI